MPILPGVIDNEMDDVLNCFYSEPEAQLRPLSSRSNLNELTSCVNSKVTALTLTETSNTECDLKLN